MEYNLRMKLFRKISIQKFLSITFFTLVLSFCIYFFAGKFFEKTAYDSLIKLSANKIGTENIVNVVIDEDSIKEISSWPWQRTFYVDMFEFLEHSGAKAIAFDAIITNQGDPENDQEFINRLKQLKTVTGGINFSKNLNTKNEQENLKIFSKKFALKVEDKRTAKFIKKTAYRAYQEPINNYLESINFIGSVNTALESDGIVRAFEPIIYMEGQYYPSLPLAIFLQINKAQKIILYDNKYEIVLQNNEIKSFPLVKVSDKSIQYIKWLAPYDENSWIPHKSYKASDIIKSYENILIGEAPIIPQEEFKDKIIVIGATANALYDLKITPVSINLPGSAIQATILDNLLAGESIKILPPWVNIIVMSLFVILIFLLIFYLSPLLSLVGILLLGFFHFYIVLFAYTKGMALNVVTPYIFFVLTAIISYSYKFSIEDYKKEKLKRAMKKYINTNVVDDIIQNNEDEIKLGGKKTELTILIADIRGFTRISEKLDPDEVTSLLNEYFGEMLPIIEEYKGAVNKFIGDAILAVFNEPIKDKKHPQNAILCATKMLGKVQEIRKKWKLAGKPDIGISIGINTGSAFIGNIGTPNHLEYTVIGDTVNVASRIEAQNRQFNTQILISESTYEYAKDILDVIKISSVAIRGREKHIDIYEIINILDTNETH